MNFVAVDEVRAGETRIAARVLSHAFVTQPNHIAIFGRQDEPARRAIETFFRVSMLERPVTTTLVARRNDNIIGALGMTEWPRCQLSRSEKMRLVPRMLMLFKGRILRASQLASVWAKHDPRQLHWHLGPFGVLPQLQGQGIGSRMLVKCCELIDLRKEAAYLETDRPINVPLYERFGFSVIGEEKILGVHNWFMWRAPH